MIHAASEVITPSKRLSSAGSAPRLSTEQETQLDIFGQKPISTDAEKPLPGTGSSKNEQGLFSEGQLRVGIDPGLTGAIAFLWPNGVAQVHDIPVLSRLSGKGMQVDAQALSKILFLATGGQVYFEQVSPMPGQGVTSMFQFGRTVGVIEGVLGSLALPYVMIRPQVWKRKAGLLKKDKDASRTLALQLYPGLSDQLSRKKDNGRAEALLIARYGVD